MRRYHLPTVLILGLGLALLASEPAQSADKIDPVKLVTQLGSADFEEREAAATALESLGVPALDALRQGLQSEDPEVRMRSALLMKKVETRLAHDTLLAPTRVHLVYKDTPLADALADFNKKTGYQIVLKDPQNTTNGRLVTLDTGAVTFWEALDKFCDAAQLADESSTGVMIGVVPIRGGGGPIRRPLPVQPAQPVPQPALPPPPNAKPVQPKEVEVKPALPPQGARPAVRQAQQAVQFQAQPPVQVQVQVQVQIQPGGPALPANGPIVNPPGGMITLIDGQASMPTDASHSVRVRALDPNQFLINQQREREILLLLQVTPEPKLHWQGFSGVRISRAVDDNGQNLSVLATELEADQFNPNVPRRIRGNPVRTLSLDNTVPIRLKAGAQASKTIKELQGILSVQVLTEAQPIIMVDKVLDASGKTFKGGEAGVLRVLEVKKQPEGLVEVRFELDTPRDVVVTAETRPGVATTPVRPLPSGTAIPASAFTLVDDKGEVLSLVSSNTTNRPTPRGVPSVEYRLVFRASKVDPARLVLLGQHRVTLAVPFTLKDVAVP
jgi:hypothetical protein